MESLKHNVNLKITFIIPLVAAIFIVIYLASQINYLRRQLVSQGSQLLEFKNSNAILDRQLEEADLKLQEANLKSTTLVSANNFLEKNNEQLETIREFLQGQLNITNQQLAQQQKITSSLQEIINKLDWLISQVEYLYLRSIEASKGRKGKVNVLLTPVEKK